jgi:acyl-CoA-binding protein
MSDAKSRFDAAVARSKTLPAQSTTVQLDLYGLFKQATAGDASGARPGMLDMKGRAKWDAWNKHKGMSAEQAMEAYVAYVDKLS